MAIKRSSNFFSLGEARPAIFKGRFLPIPATNSSNNGSVRTTTLPSSSPTLSPPQSAAAVPGNSQETGCVGQLFLELSPARSPSSGHRFRRVRVLYLGWESLAVIWRFSGDANRFGHPRAAGACGGAWAL
ncbi:unnamed protein product [Prunus armeniaca]